MSVVPMAPKVSSSLLARALPTLGSANSVNRETIGIRNRISETTGHTKIKIRHLCAYILRKQSLTITSEPLSALSPG